MKPKILLTATVLFFIAIFTLPTLVSAQNLYGMTSGGGANNYGVIFQFNPSASTYTDKFDFAGANGANPLGSLMQASDGNLYGMTSQGGAYGYGVLFQFNPTSSIYTKKLDFTDANGGRPLGSLIQASDGNFYGMTQYGGTNDEGVLFQFNPSTSLYTKKLDFTGANGLYPDGTLIQASDGNLYGMTQLGGANSKGVLFQFNLVTSTYTKKLDFAGATNGSQPYGSLMQASDGNLYGMTHEGGYAGQGVLFQFNPSTSTYTKEIDFVFPDEQFPIGSLIQASDWNLYGMTSEGGYNNDGILFQFNPSTSAFTKKLDFTGPNGYYPQGSLLQASDGNLYGMTFGGGTNNTGVLFQFNPSTSAYTKELDFTGANGAKPYFTNLIEVSSPTNSVPTLSEWALITLSVLVLGAGVVFLRGRAV